VDDSRQPDVSQIHIQSLAELFVRHNAHEKLGIHLIHGHFNTAPNTVMLGTNIEDPYGRWTKATATDAIELSKVHGHIFALRPAGGFVAYEYQDGPMPDLSAIRDDFFGELASYLTTNDLSSLLGLQVRLGGVPESMFELILDQGTIMLDKTAVRGCSASRQTGWTFELKDGEPRVCAANETHAKKTSGNHQVFNAGKPQPILASVADLKKALMTAKVLS